jgi:hypothetical protein
MLQDKTDLEKGFLNTEELENIYPLLEDSNLSQNHFEITNSIHLIQMVFMWRAMIRLNDGKFWVRFNLPYENFANLGEIPKNQKCKKIVESLLEIHSKFQKLEPYHPSHLDDITRGINQLFGIINQHLY